MRTVLAILLALSSVPGSVADEVRVVETPGPVATIVKTEAGVYARTARGTFRLEVCPNGVCLAAAEVDGLLEKAPSGGLPDGRVATAKSGDIRRAWYTRPTTRYGHAVLGDGIEAGGLTVEVASGRRLEHVLPQTHVFEDITPRIIDLDGDGMNEVVTIRASLTGGAAIAVYSASGGELLLKAATREIGRPNRWLNVAAIGDLEPAMGKSMGEGKQIAIVLTPHIGGKLVFYELDGDRLRPVFSERGYSNHAIGSRELGLSHASSGGTAFALPSADRSDLIIWRNGQRTSVRLPAPVRTAIAGVGDWFVFATRAGQLIAVKDQ